ncbi:MAG: hypothetical protein OEV78_10420 [Spirochaetia bacterium]|nr:hypothetical protein [Spirochaetia bacterium]
MGIDIIKIFFLDIVIFLLFFNFRLIAFDTIRKYEKVDYIQYKYDSEKLNQKIISLVSGGYDSCPNNDCRLNSNIIESIKNINCRNGVIIDGFSSKENLAINSSFILQVKLINTTDIKCQREILIYTDHFNIMPKENIMIAQIEPNSTKMITAWEITPREVGSYAIQLGENYDKNIPNRIRSEIMVSNPGFFKSIDKDILLALFDYKTILAFTIFINVLSITLCSIMHKKIPKLLLDFSIFKKIKQE